MSKEINNQSRGDSVRLQELTVRKEGAVLFAEALDVSPGWRFLTTPRVKRDQCSTASSEATDVTLDFPI